MPSKSTTASAGAGAPRLNVAAGATTRGCGRSPSCTCQFVPGMIGVLLYPSPCCMAAYNIAPQLVAAKVIRQSAIDRLLSIVLILS
ncbi:MAG: hypothetical protein JW787_08635 [Sedimentisphaerales bacterium]|nr:hypothetical protein [Sedimentisphaerales bacterium]